MKPVKSLQSNTFSRLGLMFVPLVVSLILSAGTPASAQSYTLSPQLSGYGTVTSTDGNINCTRNASGLSGTCSYSYPSGTYVYMNATAASGSTFQGWSGFCSGGNPCEVQMNKNLSPTATFTQVTYTLSPNLVGYGTVTSTDGNINCSRNASGLSGTCSYAYPSGTYVYMNATAASGWTFQGWAGFCSGGNPCEVQMNQNLSPTATFTASLTVSETGNGTVTSTDGLINCTNNAGSCSANYSSGGQVTLNAAPATGWTFQGWGGACSGTGSCVVTMSQSLSVTATFGVTLTITDVGEGTVTSTDGKINCANNAGTCSAVYNSGTQVTLNASPASTWIFQGWSGACSGTGSCVLTMSQSLGATATFVQPNYTLTVSDIGYGTVTSADGLINCTKTSEGTGGSCSTTYQGGTQVTLNTYPAPGWMFVNWTGTGCSGTNPSCMLTMNSNLSPSTNFLSEDVTVSKTSLTFSATFVGATSASKAVTISNKGTSAQVISIVMSGDFTESDNCAGNIASGGSCIANISFAPTATGSISGSASVYDSSNNLLTYVGLKGTGDAPVTTKPTSLAFTDQTIGVLSASQTFNITNTTSSTVDITSITAGTDYVLDTGTCLTTPLSGGASCTVSVQVQPTSAKDDGAVIITDNAPGGLPLVVKLTSSATGGPTTPISLSKTSLTFTAASGGVSATQTITVTNKSSSAVAMGSISASSDYAIVDNTCPASLAVKAACTFEITFNPTFPGTIEGSASISYTGNNSPQVVDLTGTSVAPLTTAPSKLTFTSQSIGTTSAAQAVTITNNTVNEITLNSILSSGDFVIQPSGTTCSLTAGGTLAADSSCMIEVQFMPSLIGAVTGSLTISNNSSPNPLLIPLSGTGSAAIPSFTLSTTPSALSVLQGGSGTSTIIVNPADGFTGTVSLGISDLPSGVTATFNPTSTGITSTLTLTASSSATTGSPTTLTVTGTSGTLTQTTTLSLAIISYQTTTTGTDGVASFSTPSISINVTDVASQLPLTGIDVTLVQQGNQFGLILVDPAKHYASRIFAIPPIEDQDSSARSLQSGNTTVSVPLASLLNEAAQISACIAGVSINGVALLLPQCGQVTSAMWQFIEQNLMTCSVTTLGEVGSTLQQYMWQQIALQPTLDAVQDETIALLTPAVDLVAGPFTPAVLSDLELELAVQGAISNTALLWSEEMVSQYALMGYSSADPFQVCTVNQSGLLGFEVGDFLDDLTIIQPVTPATMSVSPMLGTVTGTVTSAFTGQPIQGAEVFLYGACALTATNNPVATAADGSYTLSNAAAGQSCNLSALQQGYALGGQLDFTVLSVGNTVVNVSLVPPGMFVANAPSSGSYSITQYAITANGNVSPLTTIQGSNTGLNVPSGVALDSSGNIWVTNYAVGGTPSVTEYAPESNGEVSPIATISGSATNLLEPTGLAIDSLGDLWVVNASGSILEFAPGSNGNVSPVTVIAGSNTGMTVPSGIVVDVAGNIWITNEQLSTTPASVAMFTAGSNGNVTPAVTIAGSNTGLSNPAGLAIDANWNIYVANQTIGAANCPSATGAITVYSPGSNGNVAPAATISGSNTGLSNPYGLAIYPNGNLFVVNACNSSITEYAPPLNGNITPIAIISGSNTLLNAPGGTAGIFPSVVP
jgi:hypothetical protein